MGDISNNDVDFIVADVVDKEFLNKYGKNEVSLGESALKNVAILEKYGVDSYAARGACVAYGSAETIFYVAAVYFAGVKNKKLFKPILISLVASFFSIVFACFICKIM